MPPKHKYQEGEKVICYHGTRMYLAKVLRPEVKEKALHYLVHYTGWNKNWDEWVPEDRILKCSDINMQKLSDQEQEERAAPNKKTKKGKEAVKIQTSRRSEGSKEKEKESNSRASTPISFPEKVPSRVSKSWGNLNPTAMILDSPSDNTTPRRKRGRPDFSSDSDQVAVKTEFKINMPDNLKTVLCKENIVIMIQKKLPSLPMSMTIDKLLADYANSIKSEKLEKITKESIEQVNLGLKEYFNSSVHLKLLYDWERPLFDKMVPQDSDVNPSSLYGPCYLLRMLLKLGDILSHSEFDEKSVQFLELHFTHLIQYLKEKGSSLLNLKDYKDPPQDYQKKLIK